MSEPGKAMMGTAVAGGPDRDEGGRRGRGLPSAGRHRPQRRAQARKHVPMPGRVLVLIAASKGTFKLAESRNAMNTIRRYAAPLVPSGEHTSAASVI